MEKNKKLQQENKQLKELQEAQQLAILLATEALNAGKEYMNEIVEENKSLLSSKLKLETLENKILEEYFINTKKERDKESLALDAIRILINSAPIILESMFSQKTTNTTIPRKGADNHEPINFNKD